MAKQPLMHGASFIPVNDELTRQDAAKMKANQQTDLERSATPEQTVKVGLARGGVAK